MKKTLTSIKNFLLDLFFPQFCINCQKEGNYLCEDCFALVTDTMYHLPWTLTSPHSGVDFLTYSRPHSKFAVGASQKFKYLSGLFSTCPYNNFIIKKLIQQFKYEPYVKDLAKTLAFLIIHHIKEIENPPPFLKKEYEKKIILVPVPLTKKRQKERGFNQSEELAKELSKFFAIPLVNNVLFKIKETLPQVELSGKEREENIKNAFCCKDADIVKDKTVLLVDDVFTTGSTMEECARFLKTVGAKEVWGIVVARE